MKWRTLNFIRQVKFSIVFKFLSVLISFLLVRYLLKYLDVKDYGLWSVVLSFLNWIVFFDLGIANGVKNKIAESLSKEQINEAKKYISTGYVSLILFSGFVYAIIFIVAGFIDWQKVFNVYYHTNDYLQTLVLIILFFTLSNFVLSLINAVFNAIQRASLAVFNQFLTQLFSLFVLIILIQYTSVNLHLLAFGYGVSMFASNVFLSIWFYAKNKNLCPSIKSYDKKKIKPVMSLGLRFFLLQITMMIILTTDRFILVQLIGPEEVTKYDVIFKYFNVVIIFHTLVNAPLWPMYTDAYHKKDYKWIEQTLKNLLMLCGLYIIGLIIMVLMGEKVIALWLNKEKLSFTSFNYIAMGTLVMFNIFHSILAYFTNGIGKTNLQLLTSCIGALLNIPLSIYFVNYLGLGLNGVIMATAVCLSLFCILGPFQVAKELKLLKQEINK